MSEPELTLIYLDTNVYVRPRYRRLALPGGHAYFSAMNPTLFARKLEKEEIELAILLSYRTNPLSWCVKVKVSARHHAGNVAAFPVLSSAFQSRPCPSAQSPKRFPCRWR